MSSEYLLDQLRQQIDIIDEKLLELIAQRQQVTLQVGEYKKQHGLPIYIPQREQEMIAKKRLSATNLGLSPQLAEDILRRIIRDSYASQDHQYHQINKAIQKIVVIGGYGALGRKFVSSLRQSHYPVEILDKDDWPNANTLLSNADLVILSVPIKDTITIISQLPPLAPDCILVDLTSTKEGPLTAMLNQHSGPVLGLHPMFGPDSPLVKQVVVVCHGRQPIQYQWFLDQLSLWGCQLVEISAAEHDNCMLFVQTMRHFSTFAYGFHLSKTDIQLDALLAVSSPIYRLELAMVGRLFAQDPQLYADIIFSSPQALPLLEQFIQHYQQGLTLLKQNDKSGFIHAFQQIQHWFGEFAEQFLVESRDLLHKANDAKR